MYKIQKEMINADAEVEMKYICFNESENIFSEKLYIVQLNFPSFKFKG